MGDIYKNSFLTIAAVSASNDQSGYLGPRKVREIPLQMSHLFETSGAPMIREVLTQGTSGPAEEPLYTRGWVLQERLLSPRLLGFCVEELRWSCNTSSFTESMNALNDAEQAVSRRQLYRPILESQYQTSVPKDQPETDPKDAAYAWWYQWLVPAYVKLKLTKEDKLPALSAIANEVRIETDDVYLAGRWKKRVCSWTFMADRLRLGLEGACMASSQVSCFFLVMGIDKSVIYYIYEDDSSP
jgi:hypothetical protein